MPLFPGLNGDLFPIFALLWLKTKLGLLLGLKKPDFDSFRVKEVSRNQHVMNKSSWCFCEQLLGAVLLVNIQMCVTKAIVTSMTLTNRSPCWFVLLLCQAIYTYHNNVQYGNANLSIEYIIIKASILSVRFTRRIFLHSFGTNRYCSQKS